MTEKEKIKAYDEAIERAKKELDACGLQDCDAARQIFRLFPELKESEDEWVEKIRKDIISYLKHRQIKSIMESGATERWITYLEKQGQRKTEPKFKTGDWCIDNEDGTIFQIVKVLDSIYVYRTNEGKEYYCTHCSLENDARLWTIADAKDGDVLVDVYENIGIFEKRYGYNWHTYCYLDNKGRLVPEGGSHGSICHIATKKQRDLLFQKMEESGYKWNDKGNEPKKTQPTKFEDAVKDMMNDFDDNTATVEKIKERIAYLLSLILIRQHPNWSEEDENLFKCAIDIVKQESKVRSDVCFDEEVGEMVINWLRAFKERIQPKQEWSEEDEKISKTIINEFEQCSEWCCANGLTKEDYIAWIKSLKASRRWKPNEEQIKAFEFMIQSWGESGTLSPYDGTMNYLLSLLNDLKKL